MPLVGGLGCLELVLYGVKELVKQHHDPNQSEHSISTNESAPLFPVAGLGPDGQADVGGDEDQQPEVEAVGVEEGRHHHELRQG